LASNYWNCPIPFYELSSSDYPTAKNECSKEKEKKKRKKKSKKRKKEKKLIIRFKLSIGNMFAR